MKIEVGKSVFYLLYYRLYHFFTLRFLGRYLLHEIVVCLWVGVFQRYILKLKFYRIYSEPCRQRRGEGSGACDAGGDVAQYLGKDAFFNLK